jgi:hypothetical protein
MSDVATHPLFSLIHPLPKLGPSLLTPLFGTKCPSGEFLNQVNQL